MSEKDENRALRKCRQLILKEEAPTHTVKWTDHGKAPLTFLGK